VDSLGLKPGDCYRTADIAAANAIAEINPTSINQDREYGGWIYRMPNGFYSYTAPLRGGQHSVYPGERVSDALGIYHTHGSDNDPAYDGERFSHADMDIPYGDSAWVGTPSGRILRFATSGTPFKELPKPAKNNQDACNCSDSNTAWDRFIDWIF
jgi:hypothetical protein